ncbi:hypothetical protein CC117_25295 [Parafrankia colletiae]|uniref:Secreted protein n=1 Tax=Parafrankia colletiae TaxID=573497 RepID=A0A1S1QIL2_9ACTN|nr:hypothetical protein [Parafrankia colletiae]MCK9904953.1 hypothetical protein [Frankia sp. Cpl3]OHV32134.1 hypothetical protein CC117_25295 [Parafrankia colletiae]
MSLLAWAILVVLILGAAFAAVFVVDRSRSSRLRSRFGPEYDRTLQETGDRRGTERRLASIARRRDSLDIRPLTSDRRATLQTEWATLQALFVDEPATATTRADGLVTTVLRERGYPTDDRDETASLLAVDDPAAASRYRSVPGTARPGGTGTGTAAATDAVRAPSAATQTVVDRATPDDTDTLRERFLGLRAIFEALTTSTESTTARSGRPVGSAPAPASADTTDRRTAEPTTDTSTTDTPTTREEATTGRRQRA